MVTKDDETLILEINDKFDRLIRIKKIRNIKKVKKWLLIKTK